MERKGKKILSAFLAISLLTLSACSSESGSSASSSGNAGGSSTSNPSSGENTLNLTLWHYYNGNTKAALDLMVTNFNDTIGAEKNISVEAFSYSSVSDLATALVASANKEVGMPDMPDIFAAYTDTALLLHDLGTIASLDAYFTDSELSLFQQDFLNEGRFDSDGELRIIPVAKSTEQLFINETDFQVFAEETDVNISDMETWEGLAEVAEIYYHWSDAKTPEENDGLSLFGVDSEANFLLVASRQLTDEMYFYDEEKVSFGLTEESARKIWDTLLTPYFQEYYKSFGSYRSDDVKSGDLLIYAGSTSSVYYFPTMVQLGRAEAYDIVGTTLPYPYFEGMEKVVVQQGAGMLVSKSTEEQEAAAVEFLKWFTLPENNLDFAVSTGYIPVQNDALSLGGVLQVMEESGADEMVEIVVSSAETIYNIMLTDFEFYSNKPFHGSYDTRNVVRDSMRNAIAAADEQREALYEEGLSRDEVMTVLTGEEAFLDWYLQLKEDITTILENNQ